MLTKQHNGRLQLITPHILALSCPLCALSFVQSYGANYTKHILSTSSESIPDFAAKTRVLLLLPQAI